MQPFASTGLALFWATRGRSTFTTEPKWLRASRIARCIRSARQISSSSTASSREGFELQKFDVKSGSAGSITIDIHNPSALENPSNPLIIHLPPTGAHLRSNHPPLPHYLLTPKTTLASINYRWNIPYPTNPSSPKPLSSNSSYAHYPFPTPIHDTLAGYTFLLSSFLPRYSPESSDSATESNPNARQSIYAPTRPLPIQRPILIYGSFLGGTLATSLALTENYTSRTLPTKIIGLIAKNAVFDWTDFATSPPPPEIGASSDTNLDPKSRQFQLDMKNGWDVGTLHKLKTQLFASPAGAFDSFASPTLFFRTSGLAVPQKWVTEEDLSTTTSVSSPTTPSPFATEDQWPGEEGDLSPSSSADLSRASLPTSDDNLDTTEQRQEAEASLANRISQLYIEPPSRAAHLKFPPSNTTLKIPFSLFLYTPPPHLSSASPKSTPTSPPPPKPSRANPKSKSNSKPLKNGPSFLTGNKSSTSTETPQNTINPATQANHMATLLRRSVFIHEFSDRKIWDEELDPEKASQDRARVVELGGSRVGLSEGEGEGEGQGEGGGKEVRKGDSIVAEGMDKEGSEGKQGKREADVVGEWIDDIFG